MEEQKHTKDVLGNMNKCYKRYEYWGSENGKPVKKFTKWFEWDSDLQDPWQLKSYGLKNEYK